MHKVCIYTQVIYECYKLFVFKCDREGLFLKASSSRSSVGGEVKGHKVEQKFTELVFECVKFLCVQPAAWKQQTRKNTIGIIKGGFLSFMDFVLRS